MNLNENAVETLEIEDTIETENTLGMLTEADEIADNNTVESCCLEASGLQANCAEEDCILDASEETCDVACCSTGSCEESAEESSEETCETSCGEGETSSLATPKEKKNHSQYDHFLSEYEKVPSVEAKLQMTVDFMEISLAQAGNPHFKSFWDARTICLQLFKENLPQSFRSEMWAKYTELSKEARRLKEILDEQSSFAAEQIEIAIDALEKDLSEAEINLEKSKSIDFGLKACFFENKYADYDLMQRELNILNTQASRINALRKELIRTEMRIKTKNKFFQRLSAIGDQVFPRRKELIKNVSQEFSSDIDQFIAEYFVKERTEEALFFLREEIKALQGLAKLLTLNTHSFMHTRMCLSDCWDKLKGVEKERKKERAQRQVFYKQNVEAVLEKIKAFKELFAAGETSINDAHNALDEVAHFMRNIELGRDEVKYLREEMNEARRPVLEKAKAADDERAALEIERENEKKKFIETIKQEIEILLEQSKTSDAEKITLDRDLILEKITGSKINKIEKNDLEKRLKPLKDIIQEKKENALMSLSDDDKQAFTQLTSVLNQRKARRQEIKNQLDLLRKSSGSSGFDFEQAMKNNELMNEEKTRLQKIDLGVKEIEQLINDLKNKAK